VPRVKQYKYEDQPEVIAVDTETTGVEWYDRAFSAQIAWDAGSFYFELDEDDGTIRERLSFILARTPRLIFHNAKFDLQKLILGQILARESLTPDRIEDTEACYHLLDAHGEKKLKVLARQFLGASTEETQAIRKARSKLKIKVKEGMHLLPREVVIPYAVRDAEFTWRLWHMFRPKIKGRLEELYAHEMELCLVLLDIESYGMRLDLEYVNRTTKEYAGKILKTELEIQDLCGLKVWYPSKSGETTPEGCINLGSWQQLLPVLHKRGVEVDSTANDVLQPHADDKLVAALLELRKLRKLYTTYLLAMQREQKDGIIHPNFRQHGAKTGRMSSGGAEDG
jgi:DNA polymerase I